MFRKLVGLLTIAVTGLFLSGVASAAVATTAHDFSGTKLTGSGETDQICVVCHAPHGNSNATGEMLWNRQARSNDYYTAYDSPTLSTGAGTAGPGPTSLLCLGCHDGTIAIDSYGDVTGDGQMAASFGIGVFSADLSQDHPIGIVYDRTSTTGDTELNVTTTSFGGGTIADYLSALSASVECSTCHDVHATDVVASTPLLVETNVASAICTACHAK